MSIEPVAFVNLETRELEWNGLVKFDTPTTVKLPKVPLVLKSDYDELQRQLDECQTMRGACVLVPQDELDELQRQLAEAQDLASQINTDWIPANKRLAEKLAEREALLAALRKPMMEVLRISDRKHDAWDEVKQLLAIFTDHTALDEAIKEAESRILKHYLEHVADEIRSK